jgi:hypothetical protein
VYEVSAAHQEDVRDSNSVQYCTATLYDPATGRPIPIGDDTTGNLPIVDGVVTDDATSRVRRQLALTTYNTYDAKQALKNSTGAYIRCSATTQYYNGSTETVPLGVFRVEQGQLGYGEGDTLQIQAPDQWDWIQRADFAGTDSSVASNTVPAEAKRLIELAFTGSVPFPGWDRVDGSVLAQVGPLVWTDGKRDDAIRNMLTAFSLEAFFDRDGLGVIQPQPVITTASLPVFIVDAGNPKAVLVSASETWDHSRTYNQILVSYSGTGLVLPSQLVSNTDPLDPLNIHGRLGQVTYRFAAPTFTDVVQMSSAGKTLLLKKQGLAQQVTLTSFINYALDSGDVIGVIPPRLDPGQPMANPDLHVIEQVQLPLRPDLAQVQPIRTRSTRPDTDGSDG